MMQAKHNKIPVEGHKALEMRMREAMESIEDSYTYAAYQSTPDCLEILSIESPKADPYRLPIKKKLSPPINIHRRKNPFVTTIQRDTCLERI